MLNLAAITASGAYLFGEGQNEYIPRTAALCAAAAIAALCLALSACAHPPTPLPLIPTTQPMRLPATSTPQPTLATAPAAAPTPPNVAISTTADQPKPATATQPTPAAQPAPPPAPSHAAIPPIAAQPTQSPDPAAAPTPPNVAIPMPTAQPTLTPPTVPPAEVAFMQITAGQAYACGLRQNAAIACWGNNSRGQASPPQGSFTQIAAGRAYACGLRQNAAIACWGDNSRGQASPPQGQFTQITAGATNACAIPTPQTAPPKLICWGSLFPNGAETLPPDAPLSDIHVTGGSVCGLTPQADMACLRINQRSTEITPGPFTQLAAGIHHICALRQDGGAFCQGKNDEYQAAPPPTKFTQIAAGLYHSCGITQAAVLECWGSAVPGAPGERLNAPDGEFAAIAIGYRNSCALRPNGRAVCWSVPRYMRRAASSEIPIIPDGVSLAFGGAIFNFPVDTFPWPSGGIAVADRAGVIAAHHDQPDAPPPQTILDLTDAVVCCEGESGMFSAALDPAFNDFPFLYIWYRTIAHNALGEDAPGFVGRLARFRVNNGAAVKGSELTILEVAQPQQKHLGGAVRFGADGMLYLGIGDNGKKDHAQTLDNLKGKIIRIDVRGANPDQPYRVPPDNPFASAPGARPEIWAYGMRNPWRMDFDPQNPDRLFVADVGRTTWEEISIATAAANLGWPLCEGPNCDPKADIAALAQPAIYYGRNVGCAIIGGIAIPWLNDNFIFSDLCARRLWLLQPAHAQDDAQEWRMREIADLVDATRNIIAFGAGNDGSVYILAPDNPILRLDPSLADRLPDAPPAE